MQTQQGSRRNKACTSVSLSSFFLLNEYVQIQYIINFPCRKTNLIWDIWYWQVNFCLYIPSSLLLGFFLFKSLMRKLASICSWPPLVLFQCLEDVICSSTMFLQPLAACQISCHSRQHSLMYFLSAVYCIVFTGLFYPIILCLITILFWIVIVIEVDFLILLEPAYSWVTFLYDSNC